PALEHVAGKVEGAGAFLNITVAPGVLSKSILDLVHNPLGEADGFGTSKTGAGKTIVVDYSGPNIAKPFHVGHLMSTILGASLVRIYRQLGFKVVGVNHLGDWGTQCGYQFLAWQRADPQVREKELSERGLEYLVDLYIEINAQGKRLAQLENMLLDKNIAAQPDERSKIQDQIAKLK